MESYEKKASCFFYNELSGHFEWSFQTFLLERLSRLKKICPLTWMKDSNKQKRVQVAYVTSPRSSHPGTSTFDYQSDCFLSYNTMHTGFFLHWNISYICHVQIFDPINKICIITITNFTNNKSICYISQKVPSVAMLDRDWKNHVRPLYNGLYTQWWKNTDMTQVLRKHKVLLWKLLRLWLIN